MLTDLQLQVFNIHASMAQGNVTTMSVLLGALGGNGQTRILRIPRGQMTAIDAEALKSYLGHAEVMFLFPNFPTEIRLKIFGLAIEDTPSFKNVQFVHLREVAGSEGSALQTSATAIPSVMKACTEAFEHAYSEYGYHRGLVFAGGSRALVFRPRVDVFRVEVLTDLTRPPICLYRDSFANPRDFVRSIQNLSLPIEMVMLFREWALKNIHSMHLDRLELFGGFRVQTNTVAHDLKLLFKKSRTIHRMLGLRYSHIHPNFTDESGVMREGADAMFEVFRILNDFGERARLLDMWRLLDAAVEDYLRIFPDTVTCRISYFN
jgi:hypothetical protein